MATSRIGTATVTGTSITLPSHQAGDLILMYAYRSTSAISLSPPNGWFFGPSLAGGGATSLIAWKIAASAAEVSGTWTSFEALLAVVYRETTNYLLPGGSMGPSSQSTATPSYNAIIAPTSFRGSASYVAAFVGVRGVDRDVQTVAPTGMANITSLAASGRAIGMHETTSTAASWTTQTTTATGSSGYHVIMLEIHNSAIAKSMRKPNINGGADQ